jgi:nucleotide-binding universal stress UspA family protein
LRKEDAVKTILIATDGSEGASAAVDAGLDLARDEAASIVFAHVVSYHEVGRRLESTEGSLPRRLPTPEDDAALRSALALSEERGVLATAEFLIGDPVRQIVRLADEVGADVIVVGARGLTAFERLMLGSTSSEVIRLSGRPVLVVHAPAAAAATSRQERSRR